MLFAGLPLLTGAPNINVDLAVDFQHSTSDQSISYTISGNHDGFPAVELYINRELVYSYDPLVAGNSPLALTGVIGKQDIVPVPQPLTR